MEQTIQHYVSLPYTIELIPEAEGGWFVRIAELPGCMSEGDTPEDAVEMIRDAMEGWLETALKHGYPIPEPRLLAGYSGRFVVRVPRSLHGDLVAAAEREGVSLNQFCNVALARAVGYPAPKREAEQPLTAETRNTLKFRGKTQILG